MKRDPLLVGFNNKYYDNHILKAILLGADPPLIKEINDFIISGASAGIIGSLRTIQFI